MPIERSRCLCCGFLTLESPEANALCPVCWWQDDGQDDTDADIVRSTVNGSLSLTAARENFRRSGAADERFLLHVRKPLASEQNAVVVRPEDGLARSAQVKPEVDPDGIIRVTVRLHRALCRSV